MVYVRNGRIMQNASRGPWPLCMIPGFGMLLDLWNVLVLFLVSIFNPSAAKEARRRSGPRSSRFYGSGGSGGGGGGGGGPGAGGGGGPNIGASFFLLLFCFWPLVKFRD